MNELMVKLTGTYKTPKTEEVASTIITPMNTKEYDCNGDNTDNMFVVSNANIKDESWEEGE